MVWQLPARLRLDLARLEAFAEALRAWPGTCHAVEFRHASWFTPEVETLLQDRAMSNVISDAPTFPRWDAVTSDVAYVRLHGHEQLYRSSYGDDALAGWAERCRRWLAEGHDVHVYFDNTDGGAAPPNALRLHALVSGG